MSISLALAERFVAGARAKAEDEGWAMSFAVVDPAGNVVVQVRMDGALWLTANIALAKAFTAAAFGRPSDQVAQRGMDPVMFQTLAGLAGRPLMSAGGGLPLLVDGLLVGAVGSSGGTAQQDSACAESGLQAAGLLGRQVSD